MERARITVFDTTLRDGEQSPGCSMNVQEKLRLAHQLDRLGVDVIEAGFPIASEGDFAAVQAIAATIRRPIIAALARACAPDIERAWQALKGAARPRIHVFLATSDIHLQYKLKISRQQCLEQARDSVRLAKSLCADVEFSPEDATRTDHEFLYAGAQCGGRSRGHNPQYPGHGRLQHAGGVRRADSEHSTARARHREGDHLGALPQRSRTRGRQFAGRDRRRRAPGGVHHQRHRRARRQCFAGRNRDGHASPARPVSLRDRRGQRAAFPASQLLEEITGVPVQPNKAMIGRNAFAHEAGIHQDGMLKNPLTYEIMTPQSVGVPDSKLVLGKHSGRHALGLRCEQLGFQFDRRELDEIYRRFVVLADKIKHVEEHHLLELIQQARGVTGRVPTLHADSAAVAGQSRFSKPLAAPPATELNIALHPPADHHADQEDYLWGV